MNAKLKQNIEQPVSIYSYVMTVMQVTSCICNTAGEPTLEEKAKLLAEALNPASPLPTPKTTQKHLNTTIHLSRRSITAICGTPSRDICTQSKWQWMLLQDIAVTT